MYFRDLPDGGTAKRFTLDELLTNVMIYWTNANIVSSQRLYKEYFSTEESQRWSELVHSGIDSCLDHALHFDDYTSHKVSISLSYGTRELSVVNIRVSVAAVMCQLG